MKNLQKNAKKGRWPLGIICLLALMLGSCVKSNNTAKSTPLAALAVINASPDAGPLDFYLGTNAITESALSLGQFTYYFSAYEGQNTAIFYQNGTKSVVGQFAINLSANRYYTLFIANVKASPDLVLLKDSVFAPVASSTVLRLANMSANAGNIDLIVKGGATLASDVAYKSATPFFNFPITKTVGLDTLQIVQTGTKTLLATVPPTSYLDNADYTIWLYGVAGSSVSGEGLQAGVMENIYFSL